MTRAASRNNRTPLKRQEHPLKQNTEENNTIHYDHHNQMERSRDFREILDFSRILRVKDENTEQLKKPIIPVITIYAKKWKTTASTGLNLRTKL